VSRDISWDLMFGDRSPDYHEHVAGDRHEHPFGGPHSHGGVSALCVPTDLNLLLATLEERLIEALPGALSLATEQDISYAYSDEPGSPYVMFLAAALAAALAPDEWGRSG